MDKITEQDSQYDGLENMRPIEIVTAMNQEDQKVALAIQEILPQIAAFISVALEKMKKGGRLFYLGAGTSGRLGILDASECPPTFGVSHGVVVGKIAGGDAAIRKAVENAEDDTDLGWKDLLEEEINQNDIVVGIAASGTTPYVIGALKKARENGNLTACIACNPGSPVTLEAEHSLVAVVGPEFLTGSTRLKSGTAQKMILNMISTALMIGLGHVKGNKMVDMQLSNVKLVDRGTKMIAKELGVPYNEAKEMLLKYGSVRKAVESFGHQ
jgi:N-acetylmuramic acid 6-phosphate etherase